MVFNLSSIRHCHSICICGFCDIGMCMRHGVRFEHIQARSACFPWLILEIWFLYGYWLANDVFLFSFWVFVWFFHLCFLSFALLHIYALFACLADNAFLGVVLFCRGIHIEVNYLKILIIVIYFISKDGRLVIFGHFI